MTSRLDVGWISLSDSLQEKFDLYTDLLLTWNQKIRLTGYTTREEIRRHLILESLLAFELLRDRFPAEILDFGSGNGTPGLLIALLNPACRVLLLERTEKKRIFLEYAATRLGLGNISARPALTYPIASPFIMMKAITTEDLLSDPAIRKHARNPLTLLRFGTEIHSACIPLSSYVITGGVEPWGEKTCLSLTESIYQG